MGRGVRAARSRGAGPASREIERDETRQVSLRLLEILKEAVEHEQPVIVEV
jgi:hypothetical protein